MSAKQLADYDGTFLECRDLRHAWVVQGYFSHRGQVARQLVCTRCETVRRDIWRPSGVRKGANYDYPEGYIIPGGGVRQLDVRKTVMAKATVYMSQQAMTEALFNGSSGVKKRKAS